MRVIVGAVANTQQTHDNTHIVRVRYAYYRKWGVVSYVGLAVTWVYQWNYDAQIIHVRYVLAAFYRPAMQATLFYHTT
jgi:hypothetical protein